ncbi:MAG: hypothetical protein ACXIT9_07680 [Nitritalea sp.]
MHSYFSRIFLFCLGVLLFSHCAEVEAPRFLEAPAAETPDLPPPELRPELRPGPIENPLLETFGISALESIREVEGGWHITFLVTERYEEKNVAGGSGILNVQLKAEVLYIETREEIRLCLSSGQVMWPSGEALQDLSDSGNQAIEQLLHLLRQHLLPSEAIGLIGYVPYPQQW